MESKEKFRLVDCPENNYSCRKPLSEINKHLDCASQYHIDKAYRLALMEIDKAHQATFQIDTYPCTKCASFFR